MHICYDCSWKCDKMQTFWNVYHCQLAKNALHFLQMQVDDKLSEWLIVFSGFKPFEAHYPT